MRCDYTINSNVGLIISFMMITNDTEAYYEAICSTISDKELEFMKMFGIDDGKSTFSVYLYNFVI